ncbi:MAG: tRNA (adenosine(37)-N6)-threonylcarbamoyltransferase complex ATPase subunit type 1 TsaE [Betaproteobacteria bacterium]|nr:tRNA (adenosine(37)-N6)-threonylcarbamoyltransferase complex ATPase subunit type 1 TsaE [Betaproteobacteria bacterium]
MNPLAPPPSQSWTLVDATATEALGAAVARSLQPGTKLYLYGDLGAGKTTFTRGLLRALGFTGRVKSPTYTLVELYTISSLNLYHFDFYRFMDPEEWHEAGFRDLFNEVNICLVEWPEKAGDLLPPPDLMLHLTVDANQGREATLTAPSLRGQQLLKQLR